MKMEGRLNIENVPMDEKIINVFESTCTCLETSGYLITDAICFYDLLFILSCKVYITVQCSLLSIPRTRGWKDLGLQTTLLEIGLVTSWNIGKNKTSEKVEKIVSLVACKGF
jgi:hypothetical protein